jgi:ABC-type antimicrobial peptide transport system permease subunit
MSSIINGLKRAKLRTLLNSLIIILVAVAVCVTVYTPAIGNGKELKGEMPSFSQSEQTTESGNTDGQLTETTQAETTTVAESSESTTESADDKSSSTTDEKSDNGEHQDFGQGGDFRGRNGFDKSNVIALIVIAVAGAGLLILVNMVSTKRRKSEILLIESNGVNKKIIKKQFFTEVFVSLLVAGIIGTAVGAVVAKPVSGLLYSNGKAEFSQAIDNSNDSDSTDSDSSSSEQKEIPTGEMPTGQGQDGKAPSGEMPTGEMPSGEKPSDDGNSTPPSKPSDDNSTNDNSSDSSNDSSSDVTQADNDTKESADKKYSPDSEMSTVSKYVIMILASLGYVFGLSAIAGFFCYLPIEKMNGKDEGNVSKEEESDDE